MESERDALQLELTSTQEEVETARSDVQQFADSATETQQLYQHELLQHGKSMEALFAAKDQVKTCTYLRPGLHNENTLHKLYQTWTIYY